MHVIFYSMGAISAILATFRHVAEQDWQYAAFVSLLMMAAAIYNKDQSK